MDLYRVNLNLLVALDALMSEKSVTQAAKKLFITQAAMSNNLQQLREIFKDKLLVREKNHMVLTHYAQEMQPKLHQILEEMRSLITSGQRFDPLTSKRTFKIGMSDYMAAMVLPSLLKRVEECAPNINIVVIPALFIGAAEEFENGDYELAIGKQFTQDTAVQKQLLFESEGVCIMGNKHPLAKKKSITMEEYLAYEHIAVCSGQVVNGSLVEESLLKLGVCRQIKMGLPYVGSIFPLIEGSEHLLGTAVLRTALLYQSKHRFVIKPLPFVMPKVQFYQMWHSKNNNDTGHLWLREQIHELCS
jgi:DNA-binding transcriptional LysR family regulator